MSSRQGKFQTGLGLMGMPPWLWARCKRDVTCLCYHTTNGEIMQYLPMVWSLMAAGWRARRGLQWFFEVVEPIFDPPSGVAGGTLEIGAGVIEGGAGTSWAAKELRRPRTG